MITPIYRLIVIHFPLKRKRNTFTFSETEASLVHFLQILPQLSAAHSSISSKCFRSASAVSSLIPAKRPPGLVSSLFS